MSIERTNLLPTPRIKMARRNYFLRLTTVAVLLLALLVVVEAVFLLPTYLYLKQKENAAATQLSQLSASSQTSGEKSVEAQLNILQSEAGYLAKLNQASSASATIRALLAVPRVGVTLDGFTFTPASNGTPATTELSGIATTREALQSYNTALGQLPFVSSANFPIGDYAQESNIQFTITLTGALTP